MDAGSLFVNSNRQWSKHLWRPIDQTFPVKLKLLCLNILEVFFALFSIHDKCTVLLYLRNHENR
jgi:hypothetical protein